VPEVRLAGGQLPVQLEEAGRRAGARAIREDCREAPDGEEGPRREDVVDGLPQNAAFLKELCQELKRACGTGGAVSDGTIELQGDLRDRVRELLTGQDFTVKG
jgi:translation initiation factor 1